MKALLWYSRLHFFELFRVLMALLSRHSISLGTQGTLEPLRCPIGRLALAATTWSLGVTLLGAPGGSEGGSSSQPSGMAEKGAQGAGSWERRLSDFFRRSPCKLNVLSHALLLSASN